jgi:malonyl-CoA decarboxylase
MTILQKISQVRSLSRAINSAKKILTERGEANSASMANEILSQYRLLNEEQKVSFYHALATKFNPDPNIVLEVAQEYAKDPSSKNLVKLSKVTEPPRQELLRRINRIDGGTKEIVAMRRHLIKILDKQPELKALDFDLHHLFISWFNPGFLKMHRVDWRSPAHILEKIIQHEAVHEIDGWDDLRRRLQPDRRCFAFFHQQLPDEPLIFVEVALVPEISAAIGPLVNKKSETVDSAQFKTAVFYSISNCEPGLKGVSLGNFLIKRVATYLKEEFPSLKTFVTLSPIPGFMDWVIAGAQLGEPAVSDAMQNKINQYLEVINLKKSSWPEKISNGWHPDKAEEDEKNALLGLCAIYLSQFSVRRGGNPVAKFHLGNGAQLYRINWAGDLSKKGVRQSAGLMVNYLYDLDKIEDNHDRFVNGNVIYSRLITKIL